MRHLQLPVSGRGSYRFPRNLLRFLCFIGLLFFPLLIGVSMVNWCRSIRSFRHGQLVVAYFTLPAPLLLEGAVRFFLFRLTRCSNGFCLWKEAHEASGTNEEMIATLAPVPGDGKRKPAKDGPSTSSNCKSLRHQLMEKLVKDATNLDIHNS